MLELLETQRAVVEGRRQPEPVLDQGLLAGSIALVHCTELRNGLVAFVDHQQGVFRQVVEQAGRRLARRPTRQIPRVVLDAGAIAHFVHHFQIEHGALLQPLRLHELARTVQVQKTRSQFGPDLLHRRLHPLLGSDVVGGGINRQAQHLAHHLAGERVEQTQAFDLIVEQLDPHGFTLGFRRKNVDDVAAYAISPLVQVGLVSRVLHVGQAAQQFSLFQPITARHVQDHAEIRLGIAEAVNRRDRRHDDGIGPLEQRLGRRQAHLFDVFVDGCILLDEGVGRRHVCFGLVIVVIRNEVFHRVLRKERLELAVQLGRQRLVVRQHERRPLHLLNHVGDGKRLSRSRDAQQGLMSQAAGESIDELLDGLRLIAGR